MIISVGDLARKIDTIIEVSDDQMVTLTLSKREAEVVAEAIAHVWRDIVAQDSYDGEVLRNTLDRLNAITDKRR